MSFTVNNVHSVRLHDSGKVRSALKSSHDHRQQEPPRQPVVSESGLRYRLAGIQSEQMDLQRRSTRAQVATGAVESGLKAIETGEDLKAALQELKTAGMDGKADPNTSSSSAVRVVQISEPVEPGRFTVRISGGRKTPDGIAYSLQVENMTTRQMKTVETTVQPVSGLIEGIALHIDHPPPAEVEVQTQSVTAYPLPDAASVFEQGLKSNDLAPASRVLTSLREGLVDYQNGIRRQFEWSSMQQENVRAAASAPSELGDALQLLRQSRTAMVHDLESTLNIHSNVSSNQTNRLLKDEE